MPPRSKQEARRNLERLMREEGTPPSERFDNRVELERRLRTMNLPDLGVGGAPAAFAASAANTALLGFGAPLLDRLAPSLQAGERLRALEQENPIASGAGAIAGFLPSFTPAGAISRLGARAGAGIVSSGLRAARVAPTIEATFARRAVARTLENATAGAGSALAYRAFQHSEDPSFSVGARIDRAAEDAFSVWNLAPSVVVGAFGARFAGRQRAGVQEFARWWENRTGRKVPADVLSEDASLGEFLTRARNVSGGEEQLRRLQVEYQSGLREFLSDMAERRGLGRAQQDEGRLRRVGALIETQRGTRKVPGAATQERRAAQSAARAAEEGGIVPPEVTRDLVNGLESIRRSFDRVEAPSARQFNRNLALARKIIEQGDMSNAELESLRKVFAANSSIQKARSPLSATLSDADKIAAGKAFDLVRIAQQRSMPQFDRALRDGEVLRRVEEAMDQAGGKINLPELDQVMFEKFLKPTGLLTRLRHTKRTAAPEDFQQLVAEYTWQLVESATDSSGNFSRRLLDKRLRKAGAFHEQFARELLGPAALRELRDVADVYGVLGKTVLRPPQSQSASEEIYRRQGALGAGAAIIFGRYREALALALGPIGWSALVNRGRRAAAFGQFGQSLSRAVEEGGPRALGTGAGFRRAPSIARFPGVPALREATQGEEELR